MKNKTELILFCALTTCSALVWADTNTKADYQSFIPKNWKVLSKVQGDLNGDQQADMVLIIENTDPINIVKNKFNHKKPANLLLNQNERKLLVLFKDAQTYRLIASNSSLPRESNNERPCLIDPLIVDNSPIIQNGQLKITLNYSFRCDSWEVFNNIYTFRYQNPSFDLIGYDLHYFDIPSGDSRTESTNFLTGKIKNVTSTQELDRKNTPKISWSKLKKAPLPKLEQIKIGRAHV